VCERERAKGGSDVLARKREWKALDVAREREKERCLLQCTDMSLRNSSIGEENIEQERE